MTIYTKSKLNRKIVTDLVLDLISREVIAP